MSEQKKGRFKRRLGYALGTLRRVRQEDAASVPVGTLAGQVLEHTTRIVAIDKMVEELGWQFDGSAQAVRTEARVTAGDQTVFIDYLMIEGDADRIPLIIWETKRAGSRSPIDCAKDPDLYSVDGVEGAVRMLADGAAHFAAERAEADSPLIGDWTRYLVQVTKYVKSFYQGGHRVPRVALTDGVWMVIFSDPATSFVESHQGRPDLIEVIAPERLVDESDTIFDLLARDQLARMPADLAVPPSALPIYAGARDVSAVYRALRIMHQQDGFPDDFPVPRILVAPALVLVLRDGRVIPVKEEARRDLVAIPTDQPRDLAAHFASVTNDGNTLYATVRGIFGGLPDLTTSGTAFPGFPESTAAAMTGGVTTEPRPTLFIKRATQHPGHYILVVGQDWHFLRAQPSGAECRFHNADECKTENVAAEPVVMHPRMDRPSSFFVSAEPHHCSHVVINGLKQADKCKISVFEERLCCRACSFENICWPGAAPTRPCP